VSDPFAGLVSDAQAVIARYPRARSALLPLLHLVQSAEGYVSPAGIEFCARMLHVTTAEVAAVATFYTQYKRHPVGEYSVGVCTNTLCAVLGGDQIFGRLEEHLGIGHDETTEDGRITLEHVECNAACDYAPVVVINWEFFDNQTPDSAVELVDRLRAGDPPRPTRGARLCSFKEVSRVLAGFPDGRAGEGPSAGPMTLAGLRLAEQAGSGPAEASPRGDGQGRGEPEPSAETIAATGPIGYGAEGGPSGADAGVPTAASDPANPAAAGAAAETEGAAVPNEKGE
jgi:NADH-quinone oxidoreductase subunit E